MTVSTIITCYNLEKFIGAAIDSVLSQTKVPDEIIVVDDASTDGSAGIIKSYQDPRIRYVKMNENSGVLQATLVGIKHSTGELLTFLDGDDIWKAEKVEEVHKAFREDGRIMLVSHNYEIINASGEATGKTDYTQKNIDAITQDNPTKEILSDRVKDSILGYKGIWLGSAYCFKRNSFNIQEFENYIASFPIPEFSRFCYQDHPIAQFIILNNPSSSLAYLINKVLFQYRMFGLNTSGVSNTLKNALKTIKKGHANMLATYTLVSRHKHLKDAQKRQKLLITELDFLEALYTKKYTRAISKYINLSIHSWNGAKRIKELKRLGGVMILGPEKFLAVKSKT
ncbi:MAG: glycosyltransferase [Chitinophagaceae bacterium]|nr:MAG: glycosyltransferase [Chitinophagaceae bacterium]